MLGKREFDIAYSSFVGSRPMRLESYLKIPLTPFIRGNRNASIYTMAAIEQDIAIHNQCFPPYKGG
jgi:hypothetical protein